MSSMTMPSLDINWKNIKKSKNNNMKIEKNITRNWSICVFISLILTIVTSAAPPETPAWDAYVKLVAEEGEFEGDANAVFKDAQAILEYNSGATEGGYEEIALDVDADAAFVSDIAMKVLHVPACDPLIAPIIYTIPLQLLSYHVAMIKGTDVDQPRNLAKSVTVE